MKTRILVMVLATTLSSPNLPVFGQCRSVAGGTWQEYYDGSLGANTITLSQDVATGAITGYFHAPACQTKTWPVDSGQPNGNGSFTINVTNPTPNDPVCLADWITIDVSLSTPGCHNASGSWVNNLPPNDPPTVYEWKKPCDVPNGETIFASTWAPSAPDRTKHGWRQILTALNPQINFGGRTVIEEFPSNGTDDCYFAGSIFEAQTIPEAGGWAVGTVDGIANSTFNVWGRDYVGWDEEAVNYYQVERLSRGLPLACHFTVTQHMKIACDEGLIFYKSGTLQMGIDTGSVSSLRHTQFVSKSWP